MNKHETILLNACSTLCQRFAMCYDYKLSKEYADKEIQSTIKNIKEFLKRESFNIYQCSIDILKMVGFKYFDKNLLLMPLWITLILDENMLVECINGTKCLLKDTDNDIRYGCVAYGIHMKEDK